MINKNVNKAVREMNLLNFFIYLLLALPLIRLFELEFCQSKHPCIPHTVQVQDIRLLLE
jgi:hypothetical protein